MSNEQSNGGHRPHANLDAVEEFSQDLGPCCTCGTRVGVTNIVMLPLRGPSPGTGWGCVVCDLPADGAIAVLCDACTEQPIKTVCDGYPKEGKRVAIDDLPPGEFDHDAAKHAERDRADSGLVTARVAAAVDLIDIKERIAVGEQLMPEQRDFVLQCINQAVDMTGALTRTRAIVGDADALKVFEIELQRSREGLA